VVLLTCKQIYVFLPRFTQATPPASFYVHAALDICCKCQFVGLRLATAQLAAPSWRALSEKQPQRQRRGFAALLPRHLSRLRVTRVARWPVSHPRDLLLQVPVIFARRWCVTRSVTGVALRFRAGPWGAREAAAPQGAPAPRCCSGGQAGDGYSFLRPLPFLAPLAAWSRPPFFYPQGGGS
jgi:hypothetical protein